MKQTASMLRKPEFVMEKAPTRADIRCGNCNRLLAKGLVEAGEIEFVCPRCKTRHFLRASRPNLALHDSLSGDRHACVPPSQS